MLLRQATDQRQRGLKVEQRHRDAAADLIIARYAADGVPAGRLQTPGETRIGDRDHCPEVEAFARFEAEHGEDYRALDRELSPLAGEERFVGAFDD